MAELKNWQREIKHPSEAKDGEYVMTFGGKVVASDMKNPEYIKHKEIKDAAKLAKRQEKLKKLHARLAQQRNIGKIEGAREFRKSEKYAKLIENAMAKGAREAKPKVNLQERLAKKKQKLAEEQAQIAKLEAQVNKK